MIPSEGTNISTGFDYYTRIYVETKTTTSTTKRGTSHRAYKSKGAGVISTQNGTTKLGTQIQEYRPELMNALAEGL